RQPHGAEPRRPVRALTGGSGPGTDAREGLRWPPSSRALQGFRQGREVALNCSFARPGCRKSARPLLRMTAVSELMHRRPVSGASTRADSARPSRRTLRNLAALTRLARSVLCTAPVAFLSGCLLSDPPDLEQSERIGPIFNLAQATPVPTEVLHLDADQERQSFNLPFRSEDGPDGLQMLVYLDYRPGTLPFDSRFIQPSTFDQPRSLSYEWLIDVVPGCHSLKIGRAHV